MPAQKIFKMSEYCEAEDIAKALQIPENIITGILNKTLDPSILEEPKAEVKIITEEGYEVSALDAEKLKINRRKEYVTQKIENELQSSKNPFSRIGLMLSVGIYGLITILLLCFIVDAMGYENFYTGYLVSAVKGLL